MDYWAKPKLDRHQVLLFSPTLDSMIPQGHEVRQLDEVLRSLDWKTWEAYYHGRVGQPPIHPRVLASVILYGLMRSTRSSRVLEYVCGHNVDFMWLAEGLVPDHSTLCDFRTRFEKALEDLFKQVCRQGMPLGLVGPKRPSGKSLLTWDRLPACRCRPKQKKAATSGRTPD